MNGAATRRLPRRDELPPERLEAARQALLALLLRQLRAERSAAANDNAADAQVARAA